MNTPTPNYINYVRGLYQLHQLLAAGLEDSPQAEAVRDSMDHYELSDQERQRAGEFSEDLYLIHECSHRVLHPKGGGLYEVLHPGPRGAALDSTNGREDQRLTVYRSVADGQLYVRAEQEFLEPGRFQRMESDRCV